MSGPNPVLEEALRWLRFSEEDLSVAVRLMSALPRLPGTPAGFRSRAAEKALKAALILEEVDFSFTHDLDALRNLLPDGWAVRDTHADMAELTEWAVETRYPGDWPEPNDDDGIRAMSQARALCDSIVAEFERRGILGE